MDQPVYMVYEEVMNFIELSKERDGGRYAEEILGPQTINFAPGEYWEMNIIIENQLAAIWQDLSVLMQAKLMATIYLKAMVDVIDAHRKAQREKLKGIKANVTKGQKR